jgi:hypothetical protein
MEPLAVKQKIFNSLFDERVLDLALLLFPMLDALRGRGNGAGRGRSKEVFER